ncbi:MAG: glycosyltransferase family 2 protein [Actinobacteria bacterium]|nr:glycosyltransferase family 2 protein [Actinomycetota bacterium]
MSDHDNASSTFIIATRNRPEELQTTVESVVGQTVLPGELCIVDSSADTPARADIERLCADAGLPLQYVYPAPRGLPRQRNLGLDRTTGDPVFLIDDDVALAPDCHEVILGEYGRWGRELGGVRAAPMHPARPPRISILWRKLFGIGAWWPEASGRVRAGFWLEGTSESASVRKQEAFVGYFMSYRREVFEHERFDEALAGYASQEDIDFSYRVSRRYVLIQTPQARCDHLKTGTDRMPSRKLERMKLANHFYLHRKNMPQDLRHRGALWWGLLGLLIHNVVKAIVRRDLGLVTGIVVGAWEQSRGRGLIDPASDDRAAGTLRAVG